MNGSLNKQKKWFKKKPLVVAIIVTIIIFEIFILYIMIHQGIFSHQSSELTTSIGTGSLEIKPTNQVSETGTLSPVPYNLSSEIAEPTSNIGDSDKELSNDYTKYIGKWFESHNAKNYDSTWIEGGCVLEVKEIKDNYIIGYYAVIQEPPANRIADFNFEGYVEDSKLNFDFEDGFFNTGNATIEFKDSSIEVKIKNLEISEDNSSGWSVCDAVFSIENKDK